MESAFDMARKGITSEKAKFTPLTGKAGEMAVASQLALRGVNVYLPLCDSGVDMMTEEGCRIQVKCGRIRTSPSMLKSYPEGVFTFHFPRKKYLATAKGQVRERINRKFSDYCDVVVLWGADQNRFWIIPSDLLDGMQCIAIGHNRTYRSPAASVSSLIRAQENAWETIIDFERPATKRVDVENSGAGHTVFAEQETPCQTLS
jgi:hypothetical protein